MSQNIREKKKNLISQKISQKLSKCQKSLFGGHEYCEEPT